jgi:hypothetical protein
MACLVSSFTATLMTYGADAGGILGGLAALTALCASLRK